MGEVDFDALGEHPAPKHADLFALGDAVGGDEGGSDGSLRWERKSGVRAQFRWCVTRAGLMVFLNWDLTPVFLCRFWQREATFHVFGGFDVPGSYKVQQTCVVQASKHGRNPCALRVAHVLGAHKRRISQQIAALRRRQNAFPVNLQGVAVANVGGAF